MKASKMGGAAFEGGELGTAIADDDISEAEARYPQQLTKAGKKPILAIVSLFSVL